MNRKLLLIQIPFLLWISLCIITSCSPTESKENADSNIDSIRAVKQLSKAKKIFYSMPAPHEIASILIDHPDTKYNPDFLNPISNLNNYTSNRSMALNLGIYSSDFSYASLFEQNQTVINYMGGTKKLAEQLGIIGAFDDITIKKLEENVNNRDAIINIISETFMNSDAYLQENDRTDIAALIVVGGWFEGLYIACKLSEKSVTKNKMLVSRILEQQLSLSLLINFLEDFKDDPNINSVLNDCKELNTIYENTKISTSENGDLIVNEKDFELLCNTIIKKRDEYIK